MPQFNGTTAKSNLIEPTVFLDYIIEQTTKTNRLLTSGILTSDAFIGSQLLAGGTFATLPAINTLSGKPQVYSDTSDIKVNHQTTSSAQAPKVYQAQAFGTTDFGRLSTGAPDYEAIGQGFAQYWAEQDNQFLIAVLNNTFLNADLQEVKGYGIAKPAELSAGDFLAAIARMGDVAVPSLTKIVVNSGTVMAMRAANLIDTIQSSIGGESINTYNGIQLVTDDAIEIKADGTTTAYITGNGSVGYALASPQNAVENTRDALGNGGQDAIINRRVLAMQLKGTSFNDVTKVVGLSADTFTGSATSLFNVVGDPRNIATVKYDFKIDPKFYVPGINAEKVEPATPVTGK
jgi:hypothetical protein